MIRAILIDDERLALLQLDRLLKEHSDVEVIGSYTDPLSAFAEVIERKPDVIFLDIHMPGLNGLQAADRIQQDLPSVEIVFVTAYDEFAVEAFELNALDYLLKPLNRGRLAKSIQRLHASLSSDSAPQPEPQDQPLIRCFGTLRVESRSGSGTEPVRWRTSKGQELFAYMLHHRERFVSKEGLIELLWPESDLKRASAQLYTTIYQVRQSLRQAHLPLEIRNVSREEGYCLALNGMAVDAEGWERDIEQLDEPKESNWREMLRLIHAYEGDYLSSAGYLWAASERERLSLLWKEKALQIGDYLRKQGQEAQAVMVYGRLLELQPYSEEAELGLLRAYAEMGERALVTAHYTDFGKRIRDELGLEVKGKLSEWYESWIHSKV
ncbi:response regulator [Gorillibacterium sp. CAU 1737]|uniref:response regulator n=1 Tax=Gorillibacterium sp. CAU 1737 TaxID=3140362 RepID=UPI00326171A4